MKIVTWNVNSLRARMPRVLEFLERESPDVVCLQETKVVDELFPRDEIEGAGYQIAFHGQKTYNGVAILSRTAIEDVVTGIPGHPEHEEARVIAAAWIGVGLVMPIAAMAPWVSSPSSNSAKDSMSGGSRTGVRGWMLLSVVRFLGAREAERFAPPERRGRLWPPALRRRVLSGTSCQSP